uniref:Uncharacterized protein n=1 Tax=Arundo donax TaxID=35708 RepID=A0A0A9B963_ARUDO
MCYTNPMSLEAVAFQFLLETSVQTCFAVSDISGDSNSLCP